MKKLLSILCLAGALAISQAAPIVYSPPTNPPPVCALSWDLSPLIASYTVYFGVQSGVYTNATVVGPTNYVTVTLPARGPTYFFVATATDFAGLSSVFSTEVSYTPKIPPFAPGNMRQPLTLSVQWKSKITDPWSDSGMNWAFSPDAHTRIFRLVMGTNSPIAVVSSTAGIR